MALPLGVRYSIIRNNVEVPLIPIDQLPYQLQDLPSRLEPARHDQEGWKLVGQTHQPALLLSTRASADVQSCRSVSPTKTGYLSPDHAVRQDIDRRAHLTPVLRETSPASVDLTGQRFKHTFLQGPTAPTAGTLTSSELVSLHQTTTGAPNPSGIKPDPSKKEYCTHWIRHNSCDYMQQGCRYKHEMPDRAKLKELGFPWVPDWYRDQMAICVGASKFLRPRMGQGDNERQLSMEPPASQDFRPLTSNRRHDHSRTVDMLRPALAPKPNEGPEQIRNLIDLDDTSIETQSMTPPFATVSLSGSFAQRTNATAAQTTQQLPHDFSSSLQNGAANPTSHTYTISTLDKALQALRSRVHNSEPSNNPTATSSDQLYRMDKTLDTKSEVQSTLKDHSGVGRERNIKPSSKPHRMHETRPWKPVKRPTTQGGLANAQHATGSTSKPVSKYAKGHSTGGSGMDLQSQAALHRRTDYGRGRSGKDVSCSSIRPRVMLPVSNKIGAN
ncbi:hypothetical protein C7974DRAFT_168030 [Boeremia exigua]|uniref:uncharacterized protein n=1 Tax=Boeremia exigua TaxID=749465 RepID=UPI001E8D8D16|nr:uncharacterized protein C7974DRAFT_168030 [Boeremia exigua]KAH6633242.1 hypothetical protein C7974DRAFT_168030 [Boeremia exigua]